MLEKKDHNDRAKTVFQLIFGMVIMVFTAINLVGCTTAETTTSTYPEEINIQTAYEKYESGVLLLDVRTPEEWDALHAPNSTLIPLDELAERTDELPKDQEIVIICRSGNRSLVARDILVESGFEKTSSAAGGFNDWTAAGYPTVK